MTVSFISNFAPSAKGCKRPKIPTTLGPFRRCIDAITFRSNKVRYATPIRSGRTTKIIFSNEIRIKPVFTLTLKLNDKAKKTIPKIATPEIGMIKRLMISDNVHKVLFK
jgi:hypothetical protein